MSKWINTEDRLPDKELQEFRGKYPDEGFEVIAMIEGAELATALEWDGCGFWGHECTYYPVSYWMSLPDPPAKEE